MGELLVALAVATNTMPSAWENESSENILTAVDILEKQAESRGKHGR